MTMLQETIKLTAPCDFERHAAVQWKQQVLDELPGKATLAEIDMSATRSMDSGGLTALLALNDVLASRDGQLRLVNPSPVVTQLLELTRMHRVLVVAKGSAVKAADATRPILIVEDEYIIRTVAELSLKALGRPMLFAENGQEALDIARRENPAVIVLDYIMPLMDGTETLRRLKSDETTRDIPVIIMSANKKIASGEYDSFEGAAGFISKPFSPATLRSEVHRLIQENREVAAR